MNRQALFDLWAPAHGPWSAWAKVAPLCGYGELPAAPEEPPNIPPAPRAAVLGTRCAVVVDLPGPAAIRMGVALGRKGYQPVSLINAVAEPDELYRSAVDVRAIVRAMVHCADAFRQLRIAAHAPPAFIVDSLRRGRRPVREEMFDNRSILYPSDFPSGERLRAAAIERIVVIREYDAPLERDLIAVLNGWQEVGFPIDVIDPIGDPLGDRIPKRSRWAEFWLRLYVALAFHRDNHGDFGALVPKSSGG